jgi:hypothetical protein
MKKDEKKISFSEEELEKAKTLFEAHSNFQSMWVSSDGEMFAQTAKRDAHAHASRLKDTSLREINRDLIEAGKESKTAKS